MSRVDARGHEPMAVAFVGLGSNQGDREANLVGARNALDDDPHVEIVAGSRVYETEAVGPPQGRYLNAVLKVRTSLEPRRLLEALLALERSAGRERGVLSPRWGPRTLDLDLLLYADRCVDEPDLVVPHPRMQERGFVLEPLAEIASGLVHPRLGVTIAKLAASVHDPDSFQIWSESIESLGSSSRGSVHR